MHVALIVLIASLVVGGTLTAFGAVSMARQRRVRRIRLPARVLTQLPTPPGNLMTVEYPGPDGAPVRTTILVAWRRGLGATPTFSGSVWVDPENPADVMARPGGRTLHGLLLLAFGLVIVTGGLITAATFAADAALRSAGLG